MVPRCHCSRLELEGWGDDGNWGLQQLPPLIRFTPDLSHHSACSMQDAAGGVFVLTAETLLISSAYLPTTKSSDIWCLFVTLTWIKTPDDIYFHVRYLCVLYLYTFSQKLLSFLCNVSNWAKKFALCMQSKSFDVEKSPNCHLIGCTNRDSYEIRIIYEPDLLQLNIDFTID